MLLQRSWIWRHGFLALELIVSWCHVPTALTTNLGDFKSAMAKQKRWMHRYHYNSLHYEYMHPTSVDDTFSGGTCSHVECYYVCHYSYYLCHCRELSNRGRCAYPSCSQAFYASWARWICEICEVGTNRWIYFQKAKEASCRKERRMREQFWHK